MKLTTTSILALLITALFFSGCASTDSNPSDSSSTSENQTETEIETQESNSGTTNTSLLDRYISGEIPGYNRD